MIAIGSFNKVFEVTWPDQSVAPVDDNAVQTWSNAAFLLQGFLRTWDVSLTVKVK